MKIIVAGPRDFKNHQFVYEVLDRIVQKSDCIIQGGARGVDSIAKAWARTHYVACQEFPALWKEYGPGAGPRRNRDMAIQADALIAFWDGQSPGTGDMIRCMQLRKKPIMYVRLDNAKAEAALEAQYKHYRFDIEESVPLTYTKSGKDL